MKCFFICLKQSEPMHVLGCEGNCTYISLKDWNNKLQTVTPELLLLNLYRGALYYDKFMAFTAMSYYVKACSAVSCYSMF